MNNSFIHDDNKSIYFYILIFLYTYTYIYLIPWENFKEFADIKNYLYSMYFHSKNGMIEVAQGKLFLTSEYLWKLILLQLSYFSIDENTLYIVSLFSLTVYSVFTFKRVHFIIVLLFFFNPIFIDLIMGQIRIALAFSLLLVAFQINSKKAIALLIAAIMIHASSILFIGVYIVLKHMNRIFKDRNFYIYSIVLSLVIAIFLKFGIDVFLLALEDKRANYGDKISGNSLKYAMFWFVVSLILVFKSYVKENSEQLKIIIAFSITMSSLFFFASLLGSYGQRYVAISIPLIIISIYSLPNNYAWGLFFLFGIWQLFQSFYWFNLYLYI